MGVPYILLTSPLNFFFDVMFRRFTGKRFHNSIVEGIKDLLKFNVLWRGTIIRSECLKVLVRSFSLLSGMIVRINGGTDGLFRRL